MLSKEDFAVIKVLQKRGVYLKDIAAEVGVHPKTIRRAIERGSARERKRKRRGSKLEPHKATVDRLLKENVWNAMVILREIEAEGYEGGITILREYIAPKRELRPGKATVRFETEPGKQLQSDWGEILTQIAGEPVKVHFIVNELGYSRRFHFWCTDCEDAEHTYEGLLRSLEYFGGVPEEVLVDNQKCAVLAYPSRGRPHFNERFLDLAELYGFTPRACKPRRARTKGKDERMVGYIKGNFFLRYRSFESWTHQPTGRALAGRRSRPAGARHGQGSGRRAFCPRETGPFTPTRNPLRHVLPGNPACGLGRLHRRVRQPLQRSRHPGGPDRGSAHWPG